MRNVILLTLIALLGVMNAASGVFALGPESSWSEIRSTPDLFPEAPMIFFGVRGVSVLDVCVLGDKLRATTSDGITSETPLGATRRSYDIKVGRMVVTGEHSFLRYLFTRHFDIPTCG